MDTNQNNGQNYQINAFVKGMNSDTSLDQVSNEQYLFGRNIRITNNALLTLDINSNNKEGIVTPIIVGKRKDTTLGSNYDSILATASIGNIGAIILKDSNKHWIVYKAEKKVIELDTTDGNKKTEETFEFTKLFGSGDITTDKQLFSVVINKELKNLIKLYIADGDNGIMLLFLQHPTIEDLKSYYYDKGIDDIISHKYFPTNKVVINGVIGGQLKTSQVQYTYRLYLKYGVFSKLAPLTNKIQIINNNRNTEEGNAEDTKTSIGLSLLITNDKSVFDHILVYRIQYIKAGQLPEINLIKDQKFDGDVKIDDTGLDSLQQLSLDEFSALDGQDIIPTVIESNQGYLFGANIKDNTIFELKTKPNNENDSNYVELSDIEYKLVATKIPFCDTSYTIDFVPDTLESDDVFFYLDENTNNVHERPDEFQENLDDGLSGDGSGGGGGGGYTGNGSNNQTQNETSSSQETSSQQTQTVDFVVNSSNIITKSNNTTYTYSDFLEDLSFKLNKTPEKNYNNLFTSSLLRSLRRGELYRYGIVFYNKYGQKTNTYWIKDIEVPEIDEHIPTFSRNDYYFYSISIGVEFDFSKIKNKLEQFGVVGYEIVRCQKTNDYSRILLQCALSRPINQFTFDDETGATKRTPYYPISFITTDFVINNYRTTDYGTGAVYNATNIDNLTLYQIFSPEITYRRTSTLDNFNKFDKIVPLYFAINQRPDSDEYYYSGKDSSGVYYMRYVDFVETNNLGKVLYLMPWVYVFDSIATTEDNNSHNSPKFKKSEKQLSNNVWYYYNDKFISKEDELNIKKVKDVKNLTWELGISNVENNESNSGISNGIKSYKSYSTSIVNDQYTNWIALGKYDLALYPNEARTQKALWFGEIRDLNGNIRAVNHQETRELTDSNLLFENKSLLGWIGPGPVCFVIKTDEPSQQSSLRERPNITLNRRGMSPTYPVRSIISNVKHKMTQFAGESDEDKLYDVYYGFGNYVNLDDNHYKTILFDGDCYMVPFEVVSMFKAWNFKSIHDDLESTQFVNYIPIETKINTFFDYGMNYRNTQNKNLQLEPGTISGITTQDRPLHQYNSIYSDNDTSVSVYYAQPLEKTQNVYPHRIVYSQQKTNGENIDNWNIFKPIDFVDADTRYGEITELMTVNDILYFWQNTAFGKLSVNERSLMTDENGNTIQLGQGGVLQRTDYISTKYGMRPEDYSAIEAEGGLYWIDILNKAVVAYLQGRVINYGEYVNVQNIINNLISEDIPQIDYDLLNMELLCKCLKNGEQLVFSTKLACATSIYDREYDKTISFNNIIYGLSTFLKEYIFKPKLFWGVQKLNYLTNDENDSLLSPEELSFVVNSSPSQTKVFDNQKIVTLKRDYELDGKIIDRMTSKTLSFETDLNQVSRLKEDEIKEAGVYTDREGNICYTIPREEHNDSTVDRLMSLRLRGKWMKVDIVDLIPQQDFAISHVITKFRQSYS